MSIWSDIQERSSGEMVRIEDNNWDGLSFDVNDSVDLTGPEKVSIKGAALASFNLGRFTSLNDMLSSLGVLLVISAETPTRIVPSGISDWVLYWENELKRLESVLGTECGKNQAYQDAITELEKAKKEKDAWADMAYLGCYSRFEKKIILYPNNMPKQNRKEYLVTTFVHEAMHAYFDRHPHELFPYVATVEEPLAEFGMLLFLKETSNNYYKWAYDNVDGKKTCYRYGAVLMDRYEKGDAQIRQDLESYKRKRF